MGEEGEEGEETGEEEAMYRVLHGEGWCEFGAHVAQSVHKLVHGKRCRSGDANVVCRQSTHVGRARPQSERVRGPHAEVIPSMMSSG